MIIQCATPAACADVPASIVYLPEPGTIIVDGLALAVPPYVEQVTIQVSEADAAHAVPEPDGFGVVLFGLAAGYLLYRLFR